MAELKRRRNYLENQTLTRKKGKRIGMKRHIDDPIIYVLKIFVQHSMAELKRRSNYLENQTLTRKKGKGIGMKRRIDGPICQ